MRKIPFLYTAFFVFGLLSSAVFAMDDRDVGYDEFKLSRAQAQQQIDDILVRAQLLNLHSGQRMLELQIEKKSESSEAKQAQTTVTQLEPVIEGLRSLTARNKSYMDMEEDAYREAKSTKGLDALSDLNKEQARVFEGFVRVQVAQSLQESHVRSDTITGLQDALLCAQQDHIDALRKIVALEEELRKMQQRNAERDAPRVTEAASNETQEGASSSRKPAAVVVETAEDVIDVSSLPAVRLREQSTHALVVADRAQAPRVVLASFGGVPQLPENFEIVGQRHIRPEQPIIMEMFLSFTSGTHRTDLQKCLTGSGSLYSDVQRDIQLEHMINQRIGLQLDHLAADFAIRDKGVTVFIQPKDDQERALFCGLLDYYRAFFKRRISFLEDLLKNGRNLKKGQPYAFLKLNKEEKDPAENELVKEAVDMTRKLMFLFGEVKPEYLEVQVPADIAALVDSRVQKVTTYYDSTVLPALRTHVSTFGNQNSFDGEARGRSSASNLMLSLKQPYNNQTFSQEIPGYKPTMVYLEELANGLAKLVFVEKQDLGSFFRRTNAQSTQ